MLRSKRKKEITLDIITYVLLILGALIAVLPFLWMVSTSLKGFGSRFRTASQMDSGNNKMGELCNGISGGKSDRRIVQHALCDNAAACCGNGFGLFMCIRLCTHEFSGKG